MHNKRPASRRPTRNNPRRKLVYAYGDLSGVPGFLPEKAPRSFEPQVAIAHDILEHQPRDSDALHDEFMALGAILRMRTVFVERRNVPTRGDSVTSVVLASLADELLVFYLCSVRDWPDGDVYPLGKLYQPPRISRSTYDEIGGYLNDLRRFMTEDFDNAAGYRAADIASDPDLHHINDYIDIENSGADMSDTDVVTEQLMEAARAELPAFIDAAFAWVAFGYERSGRRYTGKIDPSGYSEYGTLFEMLNSAAGEALSSDYSIDGTEWILEYSFSPPSVRMWAKGNKALTLITRG